MMRLDQFLSEAVNPVPAIQAASVDIASGNPQTVRGQRLDEFLGMGNPLGFKPSEIPERLATGRRMAGMPFSQSADALESKRATGRRMAMEPKIRARTLQDEGTLRGQTTTEKLIENPPVFLGGTENIHPTKTPEFKIYNPKKREDDFYHPDMGKKGGYRINGQENKWAIYSSDGELKNMGKGDISPSQEELKEWQNAINKAKNSWLNKTPEKVYIRFGDIPSEGVSRHWETGAKEKGISVYTAKKDIATDSVNLDGSAGRNGYPEIPAAAYLRMSQGAPVYLVEGRRVGFGSDNEPVLKDVKIIHRLQIHPDNNIDGFVPLTNDAVGAETAATMSSPKHPLDEYLERNK